jgi:hypothetical protein
MRSPQSQLLKHQDIKIDTSRFPAMTTLSPQILLYQTQRVPQFELISVEFDGGYRIVEIVLAARASDCWTTQ